MNIREKNRTLYHLWIGRYGFSVTDEPDSNNIRVWIQKDDGEGMGMTLIQFNEMMDKVWQERF